MKKMRDENKPVGKLRKVEDFLPPPEALVIPDETVKVTLRLSTQHLRFFKRHAKKHHTKYQKMIRSVLNAYVTAYEET